MLLHLRTLLPAVALAAAVATPAAAHRGSVADQLACTPDVYRLCSASIPDEDAIVACLESRKAQLSPACHAVFSRPAEAPAPKKPEEDDEE